MRDEQTGRETTPKGPEELANEKVARLAASLEGPSFEETGRLVQELRMHQIELEVQNEELLRIQGELAASRARYLDLYDLAPVGYFTLGEDGVIQEANLVAARLLGVSRSDLVARTVAFFVFPEDQDVYRRYQDELFASEAHRVCELRMRRAGAGPFWVQLEGTRSDRGEPRGTLFLTVMIDVTPRRRAEEQLRKTHRLESLGVLAGGIAHDFNNLLQTMLGNISLARARQPDGHPSLAPLAEATLACLAAAELSTRLLTFAKGTSPELQTLALDAHIRDAILLGLSGSRVSAIFRVAPDLDAVDAHPAQLQQVFSNLAINARDAMPDGGVLEVVAENVSLGTGEDPPLAAGPYVRISVSDEGPGVAPEIRDRIFDPYFTTKSMGPAKGQGLGLAICHAIILDHGGTIRVDSEPDRGTTFRIHLPASRDRAPAPAPRPEPEAWRAPLPQRVLVLDDDPGGRRVIGDMLEFLGSTAVGVRDGQGAVTAYLKARREGAPFDLVILDLTVPGGLGGIETLAALRAIEPEVRTILSSGYSEHPALRAYAAHGFVGALAKPYSLDALRALLTELQGADDSAPSPVTTR